MKPGFIEKPLVLSFILTIFNHAVASTSALWQESSLLPNQMSTIPLTDTFSGHIMFSQGAANLSCHFDMYSEFSDNGTNAMTMSVSNFTSSGPSLLCNFLSFSNYDWLGFVTHSHLPYTPFSSIDIPITVEGVEFSSIYGSCSLSFNMTFNDNGSSSMPEISIIGAGESGCIFQGTLISGRNSPYTIWHP